MLAIKECLMREGVLNLVGCANNNNSDNISGNNNNNRIIGRTFNDNNNKNLLKRSGSSNMDLLRYQKSVASQNVDLENNSASSNLSSTSATANTTSCQQQQQQTQPSKLPSNKSNTRYQGQHPHFRHHTTPAYYTDVHLRIHTPDAADVAALNENYQSVYNTPSKLVAGEHFFPKTTTATVAPPPISSNKSSISPKTPPLSSVQLRQNRTSTSGAYFRGGSVGDEQQQRKSLEPYVRSSPTCVNPIKGDFNNFTQYTNQPDGSNVVFSCINFKKPQTLTTETVRNETETEIVPQPSSSPVVTSSSWTVERKAASVTPPATGSGRTSRNPHRFSNRKRAVRVRSESRPISALYEIICKEKGLDIDTTTNDEDSSASSTAARNRHDNDNNNNNDIDNNLHNFNKTHNNNNNNSKTYDNMSVKSMESPALVRSTPTTTTTTNRERRDSNSSSHDYTKRSSHTRYAGIHSKKKKENNAASMLIHDLADDDTDDDHDLKILKSTGNRPYKSVTAQKSAKTNALTFPSHSAEEAASQASLLRTKASEQMLHQQQQQQQQTNARNCHINYNHNHSPLHSLHPSNHSPQPLHSSQHCSSDLAYARSINSRPSETSEGLPVKLYVEPIKMRLSSTSPLLTSPKKEASSRSGGYQQQQRRLRDEKRRNTDGSPPSMIPTAIRSGSAGSDGEQQSSSLSGLSHASGAKRFITRPNRNTPSRVSGGAVSSHHSDSSSASPSPVPQSTTAHEQHNSLSSQGVVSNTTANGNHIETFSDPAAADTTVVPSVKPLAPSVMTNSAAPSATTTPATTTVASSTGANIVSAIKSPTYQQRKCDQNTLFKCNYNNNINYATSITTTNNITTATTNANIAITITNATETTTTESVLKPPTTTTATPIAKLRKKPIAPLVITQQLPQQQDQQQQHLLLQPEQQFCPLIATPLTPNSPVAHFVRTTKTSRLRAAALDKKKDEEQQQQQRYSTPPSPLRHTAVSGRTLTAATTANRRHSSSSDNQKSPGSSEKEHKTSTSSGVASPTKRIPLSRRIVANSAVASSSTNETTPSKKLVPSVSVSMKQNLSEMHFNGGLATTVAQKSGVGTTNKNVQQQNQRPQTIDCTVRIAPPSTTTTTTKTKSTKETVDVVGSAYSAAATADVVVKDIVTDILDVVINTSDDIDAMRPRCSTMNEESSKSISTKSKDATLELSPVRKSPELTKRRLEDRDKSSKRKSNLNRSQNEEATADDDVSAAARRRRRRELGMARQLIPGDDPALREIISPQKVGTTTRNDLAYHMEMARRGLNLITPITEKDQRRAKTASPTKPTADTRSTAALKGKAETFTAPGYSNRISRRCDTLPLGGGELRKMRSNDVNRKLNERTKSQLAEILRIAELADAVDSPSVPPPSPRSSDLTSHSSCDPIVVLTESMNRIQASHEHDLASKTVTAPVAEQQREIQTTSDTSTAAESNTAALRQRMLKARSVEREQLQDPNLKLSPLLRRKSTADEPSLISLTPNTSTSSTMVAAHNHIVSILKKKDHIAGESSSASSNASPVTFSANVVDTPTKQKRAGILKKRSSLDESRYYSRSHSPDERSILVKSARRNSLEEIAAASQQHGILKQSSYDSSKSDGCPSATESHPHGILKKKDSTSTPSDSGSHAPKHVSISQAVILAAAELCKNEAAEAAVCEYEDGYTPSNEEYEIRPILKLESASSDDVIRQPKPILKKKSSGDSDEHEIRPILKTSRKSSREEIDVFASGSQSDDAIRHLSEPSVRPILKTDSPSKRRSLGEVDATSGGQLSLLKRRTRSLERPQSPSALASPPVIDLAAALNAIVPKSPQAEFILKPTTMSVADRIKSMEKYLHTSSSSSSALDGEQPISWDSSTSLHSGAVPKILKPSAIKREIYRDRYKTTPVTSEEKILVFKTASPSPFDNAPHNAIEPSVEGAFRPTKSMSCANYAYAADLSLPTLPPQKYALTRSATQPMDFQLGSSPAHSISVADRIKSMEQFLNSTGNASLPLDVHTAAENATAAANASLEAVTAATVTTFDRPSGGLKRELYRDRYKTTPLTSDEKSAFYKPAASLSPRNSETLPVAVPAAPSAFKPTKSSDSVNYNTYANLPYATTSSGFAPTSTFQLARSLTQPISTLYTNSSSTPVEVGLGLLTQQPPLHISSIIQNHNRNNTTYNDTTNNTLNATSEHLTFSLRNSDNERIFEMSGVGDENNSSSNSMLLDMSNQTANSAVDDESMTGSTLARKNSVRARASMFSQLEEKTKTTSPAINREERVVARKAPLRLSPTQPPQQSHDELKATSHQTSSNADDDDELEPSSLPLSERLRFFSNLSNSSNNSGMANRNFYTRSASQQQQHHSYTAGVGMSAIERSASANINSNYSYYAPNISRNSMSNTSTSSASVTPTPMDCSLIITDDDADNVSMSSTSAVALHETQSTGDIVKSSSAFLHLTKSASHTLVATRGLESTNHQTPSNAPLTPTTKRIHLKTIGKLMLPQTFLNANDRNNNSNNNNNCSNSNSRNNSESSDNAGSDLNDRKPPLKKIGKIKSLFIENCQQLEQRQHAPPAITAKSSKYDLRLTSSFHQLQHTNALSPLNSTSSIFNGSGATETGIKANVSDYGDSGKENYDSVNSDQPQGPQPVVEMRKKFTRNLTNSSMESVVPPQRVLPQRNTYSGASMTPRIDEKYAKYFGVSNKSASDSITKRNKQNTTPRLQAQRHIDFDEVMLNLDNDNASLPLVAAFNPNVRIMAAAPISSSISFPSAEYKSPNATPRNMPDESSSTSLASMSFKRRDVIKRRLTTSNLVTNSSSSSSSSTATNTPTMRTPGAGAGACFSVGRSLRGGRSHTITFGIEYVPQVQKFEDIVITEEELLLADREFESLKKV